MNRFTPRLENLDGRVVPSAVASDLLTTGPAALQELDHLPTEVVSLAPTGGLSGGVVGSGGARGGVVMGALPGGVTADVLGGARGGV
jgi:hypothetical protein